MLKFNVLSKEIRNSNKSQNGVNKFQRPVLSTRMESESPGDTKLVIRKGSIAINESSH
jgi:hypothetical protein